MRKCCLLLSIVLFAGGALAQQSRTYGFILNENGGIKGADCSLVDNVKGCQLFNELVSADDNFASSLLTSLDVTCVFRYGRSFAVVDVLCLFFESKVNAVQYAYDL